MDGVTEEQIRQELDRVLASHEFRASKRSQDFLRCVTEHTLRGRADQLKERTIGIEVFGRSTDYEPSDDATVRVKAGEVRKRLGIYYSTEGSRDAVRIELPSGTYVPEFRLAEMLRAAEIRTADTPDATNQVRRPTHSSKGMLFAACVIVAGAAAAWFSTRTAVTPL